MYENNDKILKEFLEKKSQAKEEWQKYPRVTPIGRFLRKTSR
ncbi:hypothetical protein [Lebetimonas sp. JH292]